MPTFPTHFRARRAQSHLGILAVIVVVCGGAGLLAGRLLSKPQTPSAQTAKPTPAAKATAKPALAKATAPQVPISVAPDATAPDATAPDATAPDTIAPAKVAQTLPALQTDESVAPIPVAATAARASQAAGEIVSNYGESVNGTPLTAYILGDGPNVTLFFGAFHGNEPITDDMVNLLRAYLKSKPELLQGRRVILAPVVNPDGLKRGKRANAHGVDLNRNFPGTWQKAATKARYNPGPRAASEPETQAVVRLIGEYNPSKIVSIHQPFRTMNYTGAPGKKLAETMKKYNKYPITPDIGYPTPGSFGDYCGKTLGVAIVTYELPTQSAEAAWKENREAFLAAIRQ